MTRIRFIRSAAGCRPLSPSGLPCGAFDASPNSALRGRSATAHACGARARLSAASYFVSDRAGSTVPPHVLRAGVDIVQLRDKDADDDELLQRPRCTPGATPTARCSSSTTGRTSRARRRRRRARRPGRLPVAAGARDRRRRTRSSAFSTHSPEQLDAGGAGGATTSPSVPSTRRRRSPAARRSGSSTSATPRAHVTRPWFAIGGLDSVNVERRCRARARGGSSSCARSPRPTTPRRGRAS